MAKIKAVLYDFDGTLMDTTQIILESWYHTYKTVGRDVPSDAYISAYFGEPLYNTVLKEFPDRDAHEMVNIYRSYQQTIFKGKVEMCTGTEKLVRDIHDAGYKQGIVTSRLWSSTLAGVYNFPVADLMEVVISAEDTTTHKPDPTGIFVALEKLGLTREDAIYVGDSKFDIMCGHNAGMPTVLVDWTCCMPEEQRVGSAKPDFVIQTADQLFDVIAQLNRE